MSQKGDNPSLECGVIHGQYKPNTTLSAERFHSLLTHSFLPLDPNADSDVAIIKLSSPLNFNSDVRPACLPPNQAFYTENEGENNAITSGWGLLKDRKTIAWSICLDKIFCEMDGI